jgi:hypothetical protein
LYHTGAEIGHQWKTTTDAGKTMYEQLAMKEKQRYEQEMATKATRVTRVTKKAATFIRVR